MVQYKLTYFDGRGAAEVARQVFVLAGQNFTDVRLTHEEWPKHKAEMPFGQMPVLEVDGKKLPQSHAIVRYLARQFGFAGKSAWEEAQVDAIADQHKDFLNEVRPYFLVLMGMNKGDVDAMAKDVFEPARQKFFTIITKILKENKTEGYLVLFTMYTVSEVVTNNY
ncbi:glutathione S-transferase protein [Teladorsagia circumcincta]|uniref:glutathione transferase n=1 Tax=Teladorsagia circumcincta TaxID=45464 RepID=A0A2G9U7P3_TELCI|nr:glutathione S-transferase protein [Teladorsagia circumcincta]